MPDKMLVVGCLLLVSPGLVLAGSRPFLPVVGPAVVRTADPVQNLLIKVPLPDVPVSSVSVENLGKVKPDVPSIHETTVKPEPVVSESTYSTPEEEMAAAMQPPATVTSSAATPAPGQPAQTAQSAFQVQPAVPAVGAASFLQYFTNPSGGAGTNSGPSVVVPVGFTPPAQQPRFDSTATYRVVPGP